MSFRTTWLGSLLLLGFLAGCGESTSPQSPTVPPPDAETSTVAPDAPAQPDDGPVESDRADSPEVSSNTDGSLTEPDAPDAAVADSPPLDAPDTPDTPEAPPGQTCARAIPLSAGTPLLGESLEGATEAPPACAGSDAPPASAAKFYRVRVPPMQTAAFEVSPALAGSFTPHVRLVGACGASTCLAQPATGSAGGRATALYANTSTADQEVILAVSASASFLAPPSVRFNLTFTLAPTRNVRCSTATALSPGVTLRGESFDGTTETVPACTGPGSTTTTRVPAVFYTVTAPARSVVTVSVSADSTSGPPIPPALRLFDDCSLASCLAASTSLSSPTTNTLAFVNAAGSPRTSVIAVSPLDPILAAARFSVTATSSPIPGHTSCATPMTLTPSVIVRGETTAGATTVVAGCSGAGVSNPAMFYSVRVPARSALRVTATREGSGGLGGTLVRLFPNCTAAACLGAAASDYSAQPARHVNATDSPQDVLIAVSSTTSAPSSYSLVAQVQGTTGGFQCATPTPLTSGVPLRAESTEFASQPAPACGAPTAGGAVFYSITVPAGQTLTAVTSPEGTYNAHLRLLGDCAATTCLATGANRSSYETNVLRHANTTGSAQRVILAASSPYAPQVAQYTVSATLRPTPPNGRCDGATALSAGVPVREENLLAAIDPLPACAGAPSYEPSQALYYRATVAAGQSLTVTATPTDAMSPAPYLAFLSACGSTTCLAVGRATTSATSSVVRYVNTSPSPVALILAAGAVRLTTASSFALSAVTAVVPVNLVCARATPVTNGTAVSVASAADATEPLRACPGASSPSPPAFFYSVAVPAGQSLIASMTIRGTTSYDRLAHLRVMPSCGSTGCLAAANATSYANNALLVFPNTAASAQPVLVAAGLSSSNPSDGFDLSFALRPSQRNLTCAAATTVAHGSTLAAENLHEAAESPSVCAGSARRHQLFYAVTVPAGRRLVARALASDPVGMPWTPQLNLISSCAMETCIARGSYYSLPPDRGSQVIYTNTTGASQNLTLVLTNDSASGASLGFARLQVTIDAQ